MPEPVRLASSFFHSIHVRHPFDNIKKQGLPVANHKRYVKWLLSMGRSNAILKGINSAAKVGSLSATTSEKGLFGRVPFASFYFILC
jgi:hypothetical protein